MNNWHQPPPLPQDYFSCMAWHNFTDQDPSKLDVAKHILVLVSYSYWTVRKTSPSLSHTTFEINDDYSDIDSLPIKQCSIVRNKLAAYENLPKWWNEPAGIMAVVFRTCWSLATWTNIYTYQLLPPIAEFLPSKLTLWEITFPGLPLIKATNYALVKWSRETCPRISWGGQQNIGSPVCFLTICFLFLYP